MVEDDNNTLYYDDTYGDNYNHIMIKVCESSNRMGTTII